VETAAARDRELFFAAIARHRRASWRVTSACAIAVAALALVVSILMAPLLYCLAGLLFDLINLVRPMPDLLGWAGRQVDAVVSANDVSIGSLVRAGALAAIPGLVLMGLATSGLRRVWTGSPLFDAGELPGRAPDRTVLDEQRLANIVEEMALAAGIPVPRIVIVAGGLNAAACGRDQSHVTLLVGDQLPAGLTREQLQGAVAHLVGSIANGDMTIGLRVTTTLALFGLIARLGTSFSDRGSFRESIQLWRLFVAPTADNTAALLGALADPFQNPKPTGRTTAQTSDSRLTWREWLVMPFMGPIWLSGFLGGMVCQFFLEPLIALAWRQRKYMADATAVELTRDPDGLAGALITMGESPRGIQPWTAHLAIASGSNMSGPFGTSFVPIFPSLEKRGAALVRMGAHVAPVDKPRMPLWLVAVFTTLLSIAALLMAIVVYLLVILSTALSGMFTIMPAAILHYLLRWIGQR